MLAPIRSEGLSSDSPQARGRVPDLRRNRTIRPLPMRGAGAAPRNLRTSRREAGRIFCGVYAGISDDRILANAAAVTFYALLALFPAIAALVSIYGFFADPASIQEQHDSMSGVLPGGALDVIRDQLNRLIAQPRGTLGVSFVISLIVSLWSANGGIKALFDALNVVYGEKEQRSFIRLNAITLAFTVAMIGFVLVAMAC